MGYREHFQRPANYIYCSNLFKKFFLINLCQNLQKWWFLLFFFIFCSHICDICDRTINGYKIFAKHQDRALRIFMLKWRMGTWICASVHSYVNCKELPVICANASMKRLDQSNQHHERLATWKRFGMLIHYIVDLCN